ncbi:type II asparaginase [Serratia silvae]|uniref:Type II asparaginase n=1 Tax=Serratia silvae TaxID=2824122 RepID=A0ABT0KF85_9GAMM|nr:type II asparaginase [Serratia silvae]MCL1030690.1 type II asparaginase [Serratia silvae]
MNKSTLAVLLASTLLALPVAAQTGKPQVTILATGGTIAGSSASKTDTTGYKAGAVGIDTLIAAVPEMAQVAEVKGEQISNTISGDVNDQVLLTLSKRVNQLLNQQGQQGVVITHGTDTLEETAFFLDLTVNSKQPVVMVGSMRPATAISADGPMNLLEAVTLATAKQAENRGTLVVLNDRIGSAFYTSKTNSTTLDTFKATEPGYLGLFVSGQPKFYYTAAQPIDKRYFDISKLTNLPKVEILYSYQAQDTAILNAALKSGAKGIVIAGNGNGNVSTSVEEAIGKLHQQGIPVVMSTRTGAGYVRT